jgi:hypothetical protein
MVLAIVAGNLDLSGGLVLTQPRARPLPVSSIAYVFLEENGKEVGEDFGESRVEPLLRAASAASLGQGTAARIPTPLPAACTQGGYAPTIVPAGKT